MSHESFSSLCLCTLMTLLKVPAFQDIQPFLDSVPCTMGGMYISILAGVNGCNWDTTQIWSPFKGLCSPLQFRPSPKLHRKDCRSVVCNWKHIASCMSHPGQPVCALHARRPSSPHPPSPPPASPLLENTLDNWSRCPR